MMMQNNGIQLAAAAAFAAVVLAVLQNVLNLKKLSRGRQILLPPVAVLYSICGAAVLCIEADWIVKTLAVPAELTGILPALLNLFLAAGFIAVKSALRPAVSLIWKNDRMMEQTSSKFYEYGEENGAWFLQKKWSGFRNIMKAFFWCSVVLSAGMLFLSALPGENALSVVGAFPCAAVLILGEVTGFLDGMTGEEYTHTVSGTGIEARKAGNYSRIRDIYEKLFPEQFLSSHSGGEYAASQGAEKILKKLENGDETDRNTAAFFRTYDRKTAFDPDYIEASAHLMHGENVVFFQPFYRDLEEYLTYPLVDTLLKGKHCLVIAGRTSISRDAKEWLEELLSNYTHLRSMWRVERLDEKKPDCEVGILDFGRLYDPEVIAANRKFLQETGFVLLLEPSVMINTGQIGLSLLVEEMKQVGNEPVTCICDRRVDGLVDIMSHLLQTEFTNVAAMQVPRCIYTGMTWNAGGDYTRERLFDRETRFLGNGIELAAAAVRNKIPQVTWYGETKVPLRDIRWIAGQYYPTICRYMNQPVQQKSLSEKMEFVPGLWSTRAKKEQFVIVEDEFDSMFATMRAYLSRGKDQSFVNVLSENYMLRDYMRYNQQMFLTDPETVPSLAPDYAKTDRNVLMRLLIMMTVEPVPEKKIGEELELCGCSGRDVFTILSELLERYTNADNSIFTIRNTAESRNRIPQNVYSIEKEDFDRCFKNSLKHAYYVVEEEEREKEYVDAKFFGHITQTILPGQFVVYDGKYYEVHEISPDHGIVLRRASDLYSGRRYYRQLRTYHLPGPAEDTVLSSRTAMGMRLVICRCSFSVDTDGYLDMQDLHDRKTAKIVDLREDPQREDHRRSYRNKRLLRIEIPDMDEETRYTQGFLFSELFRTMFPVGWQYLAVLAKKPEGLEKELSALSYDFDGDAEKDALYIIEDSELDLGLLDSVIRNLPRMLEILEDFLSWHFEKLDGSEEYAKKQFFLFGGETVSAHLKLESVRDFLMECGYGKNPLTKARKREEFNAGSYDLSSVKTCDFCGLPVTDVSYECLDDGRIRCNDCASSAVETVDEFQEIFQRSLCIMEILFGMKLHAPVQVRVTDAEEIAKRSSAVFKPGTKQTSRITGFAQKKNGMYQIVIENGSPRLAAIETMVSELTYVWQFKNWKDKEVLKAVRMKKRKDTAAARDMIYEGMAVWASIQYLYQMGETYYASRLEQMNLLREDVRGAGFRLYAEKYPLVKDMTAIRNTPFASFPPVDPEAIKSEVEKLSGGSQTE